MMLRGAVIGCGFFAQNHLNAWGELDGVDLVAVCDVDLAKASLAASAFGISGIYDDAAKMLASEKLDFVDIATTADSHRMLVELAASHGTAAICQKPFATDMQDAVAMVNACAAAGVPLMVHENFRWQRPLMGVAQILHEGAVGRPFFGRISFRHDFDVYRMQPYLAEVTRFAILDVGIHLLDLARFYFGEVRRLSCTTTRANPRVRGEDVATILLEHDSGVTSIVDCSFYTHLASNPFPQTLVEIDGTSGSIRLEQDYRITVAADGGVREMNADVPPRSWMERPWHVVQDSVRNIQAHWIECLRSGGEPVTSGADNLKTLKLCLAAYESAETRRAIAVA
jgi:predicted dehydrogenase